MNRYNLLANLWLLLFCATVTMPASASSPVAILGETGGPTSLAGHISWYRDPAGNLGIEDLVRLHRQGEMTGSEIYPSFGYTSDSIWLRFELDYRGSDHGHFLLTVAPAFLDHIHLYQVNGQDIRDLGLQGDHHGWSGRALPWRHALYDLQLLPDERSAFYARIDSSSSIAFKPQIWTAHEFASASGKEMLLYGLLIASGILTCLLSLLFFSLLRQRIYLYFFLYVASFTFVIAQLEGVIHLLVSPEGAMRLEGAQVLFQSIGLIAMALLFSEMIELDKQWPRMHRLIRRTALALSGIGLALALAGHHSISIPLLWVPVALLGILIPPATLLLRRHIGVAALLYTAAFAAIGLFATIRFVWVFGGSGSNIASDNHFAIAMLLHLIVLFIMLATRYVQLEKGLLAAKDAALLAMRQSEKNLEALVEQRTFDLDSANARLSAQLDISHQYSSELEKARDRLTLALDEEKRALLEQKYFLRMVAHEFRTPLAVIQMAAGMIKADPRTPDIHATTNCERIEQASDRMASLINHALREDRLDSALWRNNAAHIPVIDILQAGTSHGEMISAGRHPISLHCDDDLVIQGDRDLLVTMINNIVDNAVKYSREGSPIRVEAFSSPEQDIVIRIEDQGRGMRAGDVVQAAQKYFRAADAQDVPGMGLGLYLVERIALLHNATLTIDSRPGMGTIFSITFQAHQVCQEKAS